MIINAILWILRTGAPWRDLPERYGPWQTVASRFYRWQKDRLWQSVLEELQRQKDRSGRVEWEVHFLDSTNVRAHQHAAGAKGGRISRPWAGAGAALAPRCTSRRKASVSPWRSS